MHVGPAAAEIPRQFGDEQHALRLAPEIQGFAGGIGRLGGGRQRHAQATAQEAFHRAHALVLRGHAFATLGDVHRRAHGGEGQRQPTDQQHGGQQYFDQGEAAGAAPAHLAASGVSGNNRSERHCRRSPSPSPQRTCRVSCASVGPLTAFMAPCGSALARASTYGSTCSSQR